MRIFERPAARGLLLATAAALLLTACQAASATEDGRTVLTIWTHSAGNPAELDVLDQTIADYNSSQDEFVIKGESFPQAAYSDALNTPAGKRAGYGVLELVFGITGTASGIAHFAHLGGMFFGYALLRYWSLPRRRG